MRTTQLVIEGDNLRPLVEIWKETVAGGVYTYQYGDLVAVFHESGYLRIKNMILTAVFMKFEGNERCQVDIVTGGAKNELDTDWGAEKRELKTIARYFTEICRTRNWSISGADLAQYAKKDILDNLAGWSNKFLDKAMEIIVGRKDQ